MTDRQIVMAALAVLLGAWLAWPVPLLVGMAGAAVALVTGRRTVLVCLGAFVLAASLGVRAWSGVRAAPHAGAVAGRATLVTDPERVPGGVRAEVRLGGRRLQAVAEGDPASVLARRLAGERVQVRGRLGPLPGPSRHYLNRRHVGARLRLAEVAGADGGGPMSRFANQLRRTLARGAVSLGPERQALFDGVLLGDDRNQSSLQVDDFRAAGLSHLLAVSGQNVAFVLAVAGPLLRRLGLRGRLVAGVGVLVLFGVITRWEPSVLRAVGMAAVAMLAFTAGRPASPIRVLALAAGGLVLVDPMLAGSLGFLLSTGASAGIVVLGPRLQRRLPAPVAVTLAAQVGVAPLLIPAFGGIPLASIPANLLAVPAAGPVMVWGIVAGLPAGLLGGAVATALHLPTQVLLWWMASVAAVAGRLPLGDIGVREALVIAGAVGVALAGRRSRRRMAVRGSAAILVAAVVTATVMAPVPPADGDAVAPGSQLWVAGHTVVLVAGGGDPGLLLAGLRQARVRGVDVLALRSGGSGAAAVAEAVRHRAPVRLVLAPAKHHVPGARTLGDGQSVTVGPFTVTATSRSTRYDVVRS